MVAIYTLTSILSAFLVFFIQPVVAKIALPTLGGVPAVWNGCMLFFQATLLCGYLYANVLTNRVPLKSQPIVHLVLLFAALLVFPMGFVGREEIDPSLEPMSWLLWMLAYSVGIPFFVISATAPLLQRWFSHTNHKDAANPYFLYAASNIGSMSALLLYPFVVEPFFALSQQVDAWEFGVISLSVLFVGVSSFLWRRQKAQVLIEMDIKAIKKNDAIEDKPEWRKRVSWLFYSAIPASLLYGVTTHITTDIAPIPFLWVLPLALYLITFIIVFSTKEWGLDRLQVAHAPAVAMALLTMKASGLFVLAISIIAFFLITLSVHWELAKRKPNPRYLTEFFLWMSLGGVLGGAFNTLLAPLLFDDIYEYPIVLLLSCLLLPSIVSMKRQVYMNSKVLTVCIAALLGLVFLTVIKEKVFSDFSEGQLTTIIFGMLGVAITASIFSALYFREKPLVLVAVLATVSMLFNSFMGEIDYVKIVEKERSIYAAYKVQYSAKDEVYQLAHGSTVHGLQQVDAKERLQVKGYYTGIVPYLKNNQAARVGVVGLGIGVLACAGDENDFYDLYEIDPLVYQIASDTRFFTYLQDCPPQKQVIVGDARMQLGNKPDRYYDVLLMDAFNSNAIPLHLVTKQAIESYFDKLTEDGVLFLNVSNRYIDLRPALSSIGHEFSGLKILAKEFTPQKKHEYAANWVVMTFDEDAVSEFLHDGWQELAYKQEEYVWTDSYSNIFKSLKVLEPME